MPGPMRSSTASGTAESDWPGSENQYRCMKQAAETGQNTRSSAAQPHNAGTIKLVVLTGFGYSSGDVFGYCEKHLSPRICRYPTKTSVTASYHPSTRSKRLSLQLRPGVDPLCVLLRLAGCLWRGRSKAQSRMSQESILLDWVPSWIPWFPTTPAPETLTPTSPSPRATTPRALVPRTPTPTTSEEVEEVETELNIAKEKRITVAPSHDRTVKRKLRGIHLFVGLDSDLSRESLRGRG